MYAAYDLLVTFGALLRSAITFVVPDDAGEFWSAIEAIATAVVGYFAWRIARNQFELELLPILHVTRENRVTSITNLGRGVAFDLYEVQNGGETRLLVESIGKEQTVTYERAEFNRLESRSIYYTNAYGRWFRVKLLGTSLVGNEPSFPIHGEWSRVGTFRNRLPRSVFDKHRVRTRSADDFVENLGNPFRREFWPHQYDRVRTPTKLFLTRRWHGLGEKGRQARYGSMRVQPLSALPDTAARAQWPIDITTISNACWHAHPIELDQYDCERMANGGFACNVVKRSPWGDVPGLLVVRDKTWEGYMATPRTERNNILAAKLVRYVCGRSPKEFFVCVL